MNFIKIIKYTFGACVVTAFSMWVWFMVEMNKVYDVIFPHHIQRFYYDTTPLMLKIGDVQYKIPKAYLTRKLIYKEGKLGEINLWASIKDDMAPWPLSESFKKREKSSVIFVDISDGFPEPYRSKFSFYKIENDRERYKDFDNFEEFDQGIFRNIFYRYDELSKVGNGKGSIFYLVPIVKTERPFQIQCPLQGNPNTVTCSVTTLFTDSITYEYTIPLRIVEQFLEYDREVEELVLKLIDKESTQ